jgi:hypothetical protein
MPVVVTPGKTTKTATSKIVGDMRRVKRMRLPEVACSQSRHTMRSMEAMAAYMCPRQMRSVNPGRVVHSRQMSSVNFGRVMHSRQVGLMNSSCRWPRLVMMQHAWMRFVMAHREIRL